MAKSGAAPTVRDVNWAERWPNAIRQGVEFYHGDGLSAEVLETLRSKGYTPIDFRTLEGNEKIDAMLTASTNGVFDPDSAQLKVIDLHMKHLKEQKSDDREEKRPEVLGFLDLLQSMASRERPEWSKVGSTPTSPEVQPKSVDDIMEKLF